MFYKNAFVLLFCFFWLGATGGFAQDQRIADSLYHIYHQNTLTGIEKFQLLSDLSFNEIRDLKKGLAYAEELISDAEKAGNNKFLRVGYFLKGTKKRLLGQLAEAQQAYFKSAELAKRIQLPKEEGESYAAIADIYAIAGNGTNASDYYNRAIVALRRSRLNSVEDSVTLASVLSNFGDEFLRRKKYDSALIYFTDAEKIFKKVKFAIGKAYSLGNTGMVYSKTGKEALAEKNLKEAIRILEKNQDYYPVCVYLLSLSDLYVQKGDSALGLTYAAKSLRLAEQYGLKEQIRDASLKAAELFERKGNTNEALINYKKYIVFRDSINNDQSQLSMAIQRFNYEMSQKQIELDLLSQQKQNEKNLRIYLSIILGLTVITLGVLLKNNQNKKKAYRILNLQKQETEEQKAKAEDALIELQVTQKQLIQSAKMASLGELTAGIAHEIQNPLNFVNNFSDVSIELLGELKEGTIHQSTTVNSAEADQIITNLAENLKKIKEHGKRADSIVKGMLQHSRTSTGKKEPTDINALADEYLRLSYHGLRAKHKEFNAQFVVNFDESIGKIEAVPQDVGRVLLNIFNNAFYAVMEKKKKEHGAYEPLVSVTTKRIGNKVELAVKDNGTGIPLTVLDKIFQPFFTTKPTGQGTGLGLSLSYDIIKAHGGELRVETKEGEFAEFIIQLPVGNSSRTRTKSDPVQSDSWA